ncbi:poly [ADP-ribose] polymerase 2-like [Crassostrea virginica]|uniref:NAD(+) ADP-ribosyltransferase n=1 Tax=Crassostrea virginica TaxID=6565 RepID=A0A8B8EDF2_CRAVI|nr:poly [ADP-ribose] polymerase 2-like [Crassostrea virginica]
MERTPTVCGRDWGRVGKPGRESEKSHGDHLENAKTEFKKKFKEKTKNNWDQRMDFKKVPGKYHLLAIDYEIQENTGIN